MEMPLYEINAKLRELLESGWVVDKETGELLFEGPQGLETLELARNEKILAIGKVLKEKKSRLEAFAAERKAIEARLKSREEQQQRELDWLRGYLEQNLEPGEKAKDALVSIYWSSSKAVELAEGLDPASLPETFRRVTIAADKTALKRAIEAGEQIPGATLVERQGIAIR